MHRHRATVLTVLLRDQTPLWCSGIQTYSLRMIGPKLREWSNHCTIVQNHILLIVTFYDKHRDMEDLYIPLVPMGLTSMKISTKCSYLPYTVIHDQDYLPLGGPPDLQVVPPSIVNR